MRDLGFKIPHATNNSCRSYGVSKIRWACPIKDVKVYWCVHGIPSIYGSYHLATKAQSQRLGVNIIRSSFTVLESPKFVKHQHTFSPNLQAQPYKP